MSKHPAAHTRVDNFWSKLRVDKNITLREIAEVLGINSKVVSTYFTGFVMPDENTVRDLCTLFDVDFEKGLLEFQHAHKNYVPVKKGMKSYIYQSTETKKVKKSNPLNTRDILKELYHVISFEEFIGLYNLLLSLPSGSINFIKEIYNQVSFDTYLLVLTIIERLKKGEEPSND